ncbi:acyltransferase family protein [Lentzea sp. NPDC051838]|uniref:acyltransferase family protein n=1 Tax=Lentzea sp. NPDC051838 TaxID=3154849 RepID=UPI0034288E36
MFATPAPGATAPSSASGRYRPEVQGLRALAVVLVITYHVWLGRVSGGVDVFFLISGFLVTGQLVRAVSGRGIEFGPLWGRMIKRLFPAALAVLVAIMIVSVVALPENRWFQTIREVVAAALYLENWQLVSDAADYFSRHNEASAVQHYWSLSIQGQFYLAWPLLVAAVAFVARRRGGSVRRWLSGCLLVLFSASLVYSVWLTGADQPLAYFHSLTRVWEFALGGLLALVIDLVVLPHRARIALGWLGVAGLVACGLVLQVGSVFPGYAALWPTLCGAAVIVAGSTGSSAGADRWLGSRPLKYIGDLSYALYLWHWPVLVFYLIIRDRVEIGLRGGVVIIGISVLLSVATYHLIENPVRRSSIGVGNRWGAYRLAVLLLVPVLVVSGYWQAVSMQKAASYAANVLNPDHPGALARTPGFEYWGPEHVAPVPPLVSLPRDFAPGIEGTTCKASARNKDLGVCTSPVTGAAESRVVVVGDSHMQQYLAALEPIARQRNWQIISMLKGGCPFSTGSDRWPGDRGCIQWNADAAAEIRALRPDFVLANGSHNVRLGLTEDTPAGFVEVWRKLADEGIKVLAVRDNPRYDYSPAACADAHGAGAPQCNPLRAELLAADPPWASFGDLPSNVSFLDFSDYYCDDEHCPPIIGNVHVYLDDNHVTATYMRSMSPMVEQQIDAILAP